MKRLFPVAAIMLSLVASVRATPANGVLALHFMDVGQGDGALLVTPGGQTVLFDNGVFTNCSKPLTYLTGRGVTQVDYHVASHYHADHIGCTEQILAAMPLQQFAFDRGGTYSSQTYDRYVAAVGAKRQSAPVGTTLNLEGGVQLAFIAANGAGVAGANDENDLSVVARVSYGAFDAVIAGDLSGISDGGYRDVESTVARIVGQVEVYKVNHHASRYSSNATWLNTIKPRIGIVSVSDSNNFGHPTAEALGRLHTAGVQTYWTSAGNGAAPTPGLDVVASDIVIEAAPGAAVFTVRANGQTQTYSVWSPPAVAPGPPTNLTVQVSGSTVTLNWLPPTTGGTTTGYILQAAVVPQGPTVAALPTAQTSLTVPGVPNGTYYVRVVATNADGTSPPSAEAVVQVGPPPCAPPGPPTGLAGTVNGTNVTLSWTAPSSACAATSYILQAGSAPGLSNVAVAPVGATGLTASAPPGTYYVRVLAVNPAGVSGPSNEVTLTVGPTCIAPGTPTALTHTAVGLNITLSWTAPSTGGAPSNYVLEAGSAPGLSNLAVAPINGTSFSGSAPAGTYYVRVRAQNACGTSTPSNEVTAILPPPPCTIPGAASAPAPTVTGTAAALTWAVVTGATSYLIEVGTSAGASNILSQQQAGTSANLTSLAPGTYFTRVRASNSCGTGPVSTESQFVIAASCVLPSAPSNLQATVNGNAATLNWTVPATGPAPTQYRVEIGTSSGATNTLNQLTGMTSTQFLTGALAAGTYHARVKAVVSCGEGAATNEVSFTIQPTSGGGGVVLSEFRTRGPDGANDEFIEIRNTSSSAVDLSGWQVSGSNSAGTTQVRANIPNGVTLLAGCYYLLTNSNTNGYSGAVAGDQTYGVGLTDDGGIALLNGSALVIDAVGLSVGSAYGEGTRLGSFGTTNSDRSFVRIGDTNNNAADFNARAPSIPQNSTSSCSVQP